MMTVMKKLRIYLDASVVGGCEDEEFAEESRALMDMAREGKATFVLSDLLGAELQFARQSVQDILAEMPPGGLESVDTTEEAEDLCDAYLSAGVVGPARREDALHVALATVARSDLIVSWNFRHIVHLEKIRGFNAVNLKEGYLPLEIRSPREVV